MTADAISLRELAAQFCGTLVTARPSPTCGRACRCFQDRRDHHPRCGRCQRPVAESSQRRIIPMEISLAGRHAGRGAYVDMLNEKDEGITA